MDQVEARIHRLSLNQLRALSVLVRTSHGLAGSTDTGKKIGLKGKTLGGVYSSLSRQKINGLLLVLPWGKEGSGRGLRWHLNEKLISKNKLKKIIDQLLRYD